MKELPPQFSLAGKRALVTGASRGIGRAIAEGFLAAGASVWFHVRTEEEGRDSARASGARLLTADFSQRQEIDGLIGNLFRETDRLDILVNNAGVEFPHDFAATPLPSADLTLQVNTLAPFQLVQGLLPLLTRAGGASIVNITSIHADVPYPGNAAYSMSKAALAMLTQVLALELAPQKIRVNSLAPGAIETEINRGVIEQIGRDRFASWIPAGRVGSVAEMVGPAIFLASAASSYCTGTTLYADGAYRQHIVRYRVPAEN